MSTATEVASPQGQERFTVSLATYRWVAEAALVTLTLIIFTGAAVRLTGSGLGCPDWPACNGTRIVPPLDVHSLIEFGNRMMTSVVGIPSVAVAVLAYRLRPLRRDLIRPALVLPLGVLGQAVLGGLTVIFDLHWQLVIGHYLLSAVLLVAAVVLVRRVRRPEGAPANVHPGALVNATRALVAFGGFIIVAGTFATAAGPHAGGAGTGDVVERLDAWGSGTLKGLIDVHGHSAAAWGLLAVGLWLFARARGAHPELRRALTAVCVLIAAQGALGLWQYHSALPAEIVWAHASLAAVLWIALIWSWLAAGRAAPPGS